ncbi:MAG: MBL fold metallo-hydrolase [Candidatus Zixiibacteriota bacterium]
MTQDSFTILGSSSGLPQANRACSGYLLDTGGSLSLIDCGGGVTSSFLRQGFDPLKLDRVFISHTHSDHCCELSLVIQMLHVLRANRRLDVFVPDEFVRPFLSWLNAVYMFPQHLALDLHIRGYADGFSFQGDRFELTAHANQHLEKAAEIIEQYDIPNRMQCHSFRIATEKARLFYSADIASFEEIIPHLRDLDYALIESTHIELSKLIQYAKSSSVKKYILTHLGSPEELDTLRGRIEAAGVGDITLAEDGLRLQL